MPPRPGQDPYAPSPDPAQHPGYAGSTQHIETQHTFMIYLFIYFIFYYFFIIISPWSDYPTSPAGPGTARSSAGSLPGRPSLVEQHNHFLPEQLYGNHEGNYGNPDNYGQQDGNYATYEGNYSNYGQYGDPNLSNSVFEESGEGVNYGDYSGPLPGRLGSVSHTPLPGHAQPAPRAVFDEDDGEPGQTPPRPSQPSLNSDHKPGLFFVVLISLLLIILLSPPLS